MSEDLQYQVMKLSLMHDREGRPILLRAEALVQSGPDFTYEQARSLVFNAPNFEGESVRFAIGRTIYAVPPPALKTAEVQEDGAGGRALVLELHEGPKFTLQGEMAAGVGTFLLQEGYIHAPNP